MSDQTSNQTTPMQLPLAPLMQLQPAGTAFVPAVEVPLEAPLALFKATARGLAECGMPLGTLLAEVLRAYDLDPKSIDVEGVNGMTLLHMGENRETTH